MKDHTPTPWIKADVRGIIRATTKTGNPILVFKLQSAEGGTKYEENTDLVFRAVNNHDALVAALEGLFSECAMIHKYGGEASNARAADAAIKTALNALALAKGKTPDQRKEFDKKWPGLAEQIEEEEG